jgi:hypothetical protein
VEDGFLDRGMRYELWAMSEGTDTIGDGVRVEGEI